MESTKKWVENIPVEISIGGRNTTLISAGVLGPFSLLFNEQFLAILETFEQFVTSYPWASLPFFFTSLTIWLFEHFCSCCCNGNPCYFCAFCEICGLLEGLFTFRLLYSSHIVRGVSFLAMKSFRSRSLRNRWTFGGPSLPPFLISMNSSKICYSWYWFDICWSVFLFASKLLVTFAIFGKFVDF